MKLRCEKHNPPKLAEWPDCPECYHERKTMSNQDMGHRTEDEIEKVNHLDRISKGQFAMSMEKIVYCVGMELNRARKKFPNNEDMLHAFVEEAGEVTREFLHHKWEKGSNFKCYKELIQTIAMAVRLIQEGDPNFPYEPSGKDYQDY